MTAKYLKFYLLLALIEGAAALFFTLGARSDPESARLFGYSYARLALVGLNLLTLHVFVALAFAVWRNPATASAKVDALVGGRAGLAAEFLLGGAVLCAWLWLLSYLTLLAPLRALIAWAGLLLGQAWWLVRRLDVASQSARRTGYGWIRAIDADWDPEQRKTFRILSVLAVIYFSSFFPINLQSANDPATFAREGGDEYVIFPIVESMLTPGDTFAGTVYHAVIHEDYHYGYPFFLLSALTLLIPRVVFGADFAAHTQVNLLILRQLVSVLPLILSLLVMVYVVTKFRSAWRAVAMFVVLALMPGVVKYNMRFWHPDALMVLAVTLTFYFLQRDRLRFGRDFYAAAVMCGAAAAIKLYGFFFVLAIAGYLLAGLLRRALDVRRMVLAALGFLLLMGGTLAVSSPFLFVPSARARFVEILSEKKGELTTGYDEPDPEGAYGLGLSTWLRYFKGYYAEPFFFFFLAAGLAAASLWGSQTYISRLILAWVLVTGGYIIYFVAVKAPQYSLALFIPFYAGAFLLPSAAAGDSWLARRIGPRALGWVAGGALVGQAVFNLVTLFTSPLLR